MLLCDKICVAHSLTYSIDQNLVNIICIFICSRALFPNVVSHLLFNLRVDLAIVHKPIAHKPITALEKKNKKTP